MQTYWKAEIQHNVFLTSGLKFKVIRFTLQLRYLKEITLEDIGYEAGWALEPV
jgi:hypothetical protein